MDDLKIGNLFDHQYVLSSDARKIIEDLEYIYQKIRISNKNISPIKSINECVLIDLRADLLIMLDSEKTWSYKSKKIYSDTYKNLLKKIETQKQVIEYYETIIK
ncbi:hypothetical protein [Chryseobacterium sp. WLY505]|uniref:hypothetical protein n=1 Tax=Chryseobacterium sp. WLY505 TaxID=3068892 RepID=UPI002796E244|nr:hypothetical protein [Chryseobacterium sp. WLY505]MDQ1859276.1 hypothetical protein [Chryseobacterium sp. WLY505]